MSAHVACWGDSRHREGDPHEHIPAAASSNQLLFIQRIKYALLAFLTKKVQREGNKNANPNTKQIFKMKFTKPQREEIEVVHAYITLPTYRNRDTQLKKLVY